jgi:hypothetical protein
MAGVHLDAADVADVTCFGKRSRSCDRLERARSQARLDGRLQSPNAERRRRGECEGH